MLRKFYATLNKPVPEEIETLFKYHDQITTASFRGFDEPWRQIGKTREKVTQTVEEENPQGEAEEQAQILDETEVTYLSELYKKKIERNKDPAMLSAIHKKAVYTAKMLTVEMIEG